MERLVFQCTFFTFSFLFLNDEKRRGTSTVGGLELVKSNEWLLSEDGAGNKNKNDDDTWEMRERKQRMNEWRREITNERGL